MRIGVVACECFKQELEMVLEGDEDVSFKQYMEFGLHSYPQDLKRELIRTVNSLKGKVDAVFLAYGICNSLSGIVNEVDVPTVTIAADDCIGIMLTPEEYAKERKICAGTMFHIPFMSKMGVDYFEKDLASKMPNYKELGVDIDWFMGIMFDGYSRCLYIDTGIDDREHCEERSQDFARQLNLRYESRKGTRKMLEDCLRQAKEMASRPS